MAMTLLSQTYSFLYFDKMKIKKIPHCQNSSKIQYTIVERSKIDTPHTNT
jgi:hypothetical protein